MNIVPKFVAEKVKSIKMSEGGCNVADDVILAQVAANIRRGLPQIKNYDRNPATALLVCGGPSLALTEKELVEAYWAGGKIVAVNGAYQWCIDRNLKPSAMVMLDARSFNKRFAETPIPGCKYLLASQCHPETFDVCIDRDVLIWHACTAGEPELELINKYYFNRTLPITLGTTVGVRSLSLLRMLGFVEIDIFGLDSCWLDGKHHAYDQPENRDKDVPIWLRPKAKEGDEHRDDKAQRFICAPWHVQQAMDFMRVIRERGDHFHLNVRGPGLIATIMRTGAEIQMGE